ncbi:LacI family DNA-binding transcriptional regulator [Luteipulveratus mongoliensis]|uniref:HTH lacI-type domain-containing protein n=1 Tax=Luteipulveratus mongoliensis TaxID=571913 RepID=A0A0K1JN24_9MICO|nr:LacI family DNA-binding transcriptional regulator [Luteipulveratus mongoliensis]AKU17980.1 hypothetical protein VV02_22460 [Luteipulveratus mongoliensis]
MSRTRAGAGRLSMADVAAKAGVSSQTVSRVLSGRPHVNAETRSRVLWAAEQLGYEPNAAARALASGRTRVIGLVTIEGDTVTRGMVTKAVEGAARTAGYRVSDVGVRTPTATAVAQALTQLRRQNVDGIVLAAPLIDPDATIERLTAETPTVAIDGSRTSSTEIVAVDQIAVGRIATEHLLSLGHQTVHYVSGPTTWVDTVGRTEGWRSALKAAGRDEPPILIGDWSPESGHHAGRVLADNPRVTAVFVASDEMAFGVLHAFVRAGRRVPDDISVVGVDDVPLAAYAHPPLTTVRQPFADVGARAVRRLVELMDSSDDRAPTLIAPTLVRRESVGPPPAPASQ